MADVLTPEQRARATFALDDPERQNWFYTPVARKGITIKDLDPAQRQLANVLLGAGLSQQGLLKAATVMSLEPILREIEQGKGPVRDPELYYFTLFGQPETPAPWAWRFEGHHISLHYAVTGRGVVASTPSFFGSNPSEVQQGPRKGLRALPREEDLARAFVKSLDDKQRAVAVVTDKAPADILSTNGRKADPIKPAGLQANKLGQKQSEMLMSLSLQCLEVLRLEETWSNLGTAGRTRSRSTCRRGSGSGLSGIKSHSPIVHLVRCFLLPFPSLHSVAI